MTGPQNVRVEESAFHHAWVKLTTQEPRQCGPGSHSRLIPDEMPVIIISDPGKVMYKP